VTDPFLAEIRMFAGTFAPNGWALCNGQLLPISQNTALFSLLGTNYGGDGRSTFGLPNLMGSAPLQQGQGPGLSARFLGETGGVPSVTLLSSEMPIHTHVPQAVTAAPGDTNNPVGNAWASATFGRVAENLYSTNPPDLQMSVQAVNVAGGSQPHNNLPPYLCVTFIIALQGIFPQRP
jgi:microcystin-dependent protein